MPIGPFESEVLRLLASNRNPDSYVGGATVLHQAPDSPRASADIDVFHDTTPAVHDAAARDTETLQTAGCEVRIVSRQESFCRGIVSKGPLVTKLEWVQDSAFRFFPVEPDVQMGCFYLDRAGKPVCPDPAAPDFPKLTRHYGSVKGAWPRIVER
jgi:hypothetical protein